MSSKNDKRPVVRLSSPTLCHQCKSITIDFATSDETPTKRAGPVAVEYELRDVFPEFPNLQSLASAGCQFCQFLRTAILNEFQNHPLHHDPSFSDAEIAQWKGNLIVKVPEFDVLMAYRRKRQKISFQEELEGPFRWTVWLEFLGQTREILIDVFTDPAKIPELPSPEPLSDANVLLVSTWVLNCVGFHSTCRFGIQSYSPTRLVDVRSSSDGREPCIVLTEGRHFPYLALSHCWGSPQATLLRYRTERANLNNRLSRLPMSELPQTLQDAITVTRRLGFQYIWIDSLCIVQDDPMDWEREASEMQNVYAQSILTIAATSANSSAQGFLRRQSYQSSTISYQVMNDCDGERKWYLRSPSPSHSSTLISKSWWNRRGWTFQERMLSRRILHFTEQVLYFECWTSERVEWDTFQLGGEILFPPWIPEPDLKHPDDRHDLWRTRLNRARDKYNDWNEIVRKYTKRNLSFPGDKLPALSGIAAEMARYIGDDYLAGLWRGNLLHDILWISKPPHLSLTKPKDYRAPSWSWSSLDGEIIFSSPRVGIEWCIQILDAKVVVAGQNPFGGVTGGHLLLSGALVHASLIQQSINCHPGGYGGKIVPDTQATFTPESDISALLVVIERQSYGPRRSTGLLLEKIPHADEEHEYRRFGRFEICEDIVEEGNHKAGATGKKLSASLFAREGESRVVRIV